MWALYIYRRGELELSLKKLRVMFLTFSLTMLCGVFLAACGGDDSPPALEPPVLNDEEEEEFSLKLNSASGDHQVKLAWEVSGERDESQIIGYEYQRSPTEDGFGNTWIPIPGGADIREVIVSDLTEGETYYFRVRAVNPDGAALSSSSDVDAMAYDGVAAEPSSPPSLSAIPGDAQVTLIWHVPEAIGASSVTGYEYQQSFTRGNFSGIEWLPISLEEDTEEDSTRQFTVSGLNNGKTYYFRVRASNAQGGGKASLEVSAFPARIFISRPGPPVDFVATPGNRQVTLNWEAPLPTGSSPIVHYAYQKSPTIDGFDRTWHLIPGGSETREVVVSGLRGGGVHYFRLRAVNRERKGPFAVASTVPYEGLSVRPSSPVNVVAIPGDRQVTLQWEAPHLVGASEVTGYEYQQSLRRDGFSQTWVTVPGGGSAREVVVAALRAARPYYFQIRAVNARGGGEASVEVSTVPQIPTEGEGQGKLRPPRQVQVRPGDNQITLTWEEPLLVGDTEVTGYEYQYVLRGNDWGDMWTQILGGAAVKTLAVTGLASGEVYYFRLRAFNGEEKSRFVEVLSRPYDGATRGPSAPLNLSATPGDRQVLLIWEVPERVGVSRILYYEYQHGLEGEDLADFWHRVPGDGSVSQILISGLEGALTYQFQLRAVNFEGVGEIAQVSQTVYEGATVRPSAPVNLQVMASLSQITLMWEAPQTVGASPVTGYEYQYVLDSGQFGETWIAVSGGASAREVTVTSLTEGETYAFRLRAVNGGGAGSLAEISGEAYESDLFPSAPTSLAVTTGDRRVTLSWEAPSDVGSGVTHYEYQWSSTSGDYGGSPWVTVWGEDEVREVVVPFLKGETYYFRMRVRSAEGFGVISAEVSATTEDTSEEDMAVCSDSGVTTEILPQGSGTESDPFVLCLPEHLNLIGDRVAHEDYAPSAHYVMGQGIDLEYETFSPIGGTSQFTGNFDGRGEKIIHLKVAADRGHAGLFYYLGEKGVIERVALENFDVQGGTRIGALASSSRGTIRDCYAWTGMTTILQMSVVEVE